VVEKALAALPGGIDKIYLRGDSALYEHELMRWLDERAIGYAIFGRYEPTIGRLHRRSDGGSLETRPTEVDAIRDGPRLITAQRRHLEEGRGLAAPLSCDPHSPAPG